MEWIGIMMRATMVAFLGFTSAQTFHYAVPEWIPYLVLIITISSNEMAMERWRIPSDKELDQIKADEELALTPKVVDVSQEVDGTATK